MGLPSELVLIEGGIVAGDDCSCGGGMGVPLCLEDAAEFRRCLGTAASVLPLTVGYVFQ